MNHLGLYLHIPFCIRKCFYCDFCSFPSPRDEEMSAYVRELTERLRQFAPQAAKAHIATVYLGGGTPTLLPIREMERLFEVLHGHFSIDRDAEITCECNPATADLAYLRSLRSLGVNRLSLGLQSVHDRELAALGRLHSFADFCRTYGDARRAGFDNVSVDLMYGLPDQTLADFEQSLDTLLSMEPEHLSAYGLKIEEGTRFAAIQDALAFPNEDIEFAMYQALIHRTAQASLPQYEISNFAKEGFASQHNLRYWKRQDYMGFGVAAYSCLGGVRFGNSRDLRAFLRGEDITAEREILTWEDEKAETVMLSLRLCEGLSLSAYQERFGQNFLEEHPNTERWIKEGFLRLVDDRLAFTTKGFFVSNSILSELL